MQIWLELLLREGAFLALLVMLGAGPAAYMSERFDVAARVAMAPVLGFCVGMSVTTTLLQFWAANSTHWILVPLALTSVSLAVRKISHSTEPGRRRMSLAASDVAQLAVVCLVVAGPLTYSLHQRHTVGPAAYTYTDVDGYVAEQDGELTKSTADAASAWRSARRTGAPLSNLTQFNWGFRASYDQNLDASALEANFGGLLGLGATETFAPFLIVLLLSGALGAFAVVRYATGSRTWVAALAGGLFGGPFFLELFYDTYQAAICGLALVIPLIVIAYEQFRTRRIADLLLCGLLLSGFLNVYPLFVPLVIVAMALVLAWLAGRGRRSGHSLAPYVRFIGLRLLALAVMAALLEPVAFVRDLHYARDIINNTIPLPRVGYSLPLDVLPGWLLQTREFWNGSSVTSDVNQLLLGGLVPLCLFGLIAYALWRFRSAVALVVLAAVCALVAEYSYTSRAACTYCAQRNLLPLAPIGVILTALGVYALLTSGVRTRRFLGMLGALLVAVAVGERTRVELTRYVNSSYFLDSGNRAMLARVPQSARSVALEGYGASLHAQAEEALVYFLAHERLGDRVSLSTSLDDHQGLAYLTFAATSGAWPAFDPNYGYVLSRLGGVKTDRRLLARSGPIALEARAQPLDVIPILGLAVPLARLDPSGVAWLQPSSPLVMYVTGATSARRVWAKVRLRVREPVTLNRRMGVRWRLRGDTLTACVPTTGSSPLRIARLSVSAAPIAGPVPSGSFPPPVPLEGIALTGMRADAGSCSP